MPGVYVAIVVFGGVLGGSGLGGRLGGGVPGWLVQVRW